jgi:catechol 2,3-dioxygenase-like lactoylglutathione lyase family enzyme
MADFKLNHLHFKTADPKATADWYVNNLGATVVQEIGDIGYKLDLHGIPMNVTTLVDGQPIEQFYGLEHVAIDTNDLPGTVAQLEGSGAKILAQFQVGSGRNVCFFEGPDGVRLEVLETPG